MRDDRDRETFLTTLESKRGSVHQFWHLRSMQRDALSQGCLMPRNVRVEFGRCRLPVGRSRRPGALPRRALPS